MSIILIWNIFNSDVGTFHEINKDIFVSFEGFSSSADEYSFLLGYNTVFQANQMPAFERDVLPFISKSQ